MTAIPASREDTFPKLLARNASVRGSRTAIRHKDLGIWQAWTWSQVDEITARLTVANLPVAVSLAEVPMTIRGFGHVKQRNLDEAKARQEDLLSRLRTERGVPSMAAE